MSATFELNENNNTEKAVPNEVHASATATSGSTTMSSRSHMSNSSTTTPPMTVHTFHNITNVRIPIIGYEVMEERARFTVYKLRIENPFTNDCWLVLRRYTDFVRLNKKLKSLTPSVQLNLPRKNLFGNNFSNSFLEQRVHGLQTFINSIMANESMRNVQAVKDFFCLEEPPSYTDSLEECRALFEAQEETICHLKRQLQNRDDEIRILQQKLASSTREIDALKMNSIQRHIDRGPRATDENCLPAISGVSDMKSNADKV